jgi:D-3-phosphoglycerate dehydrogenase / 2-oxoglutarate reductase
MDAILMAHIVAVTDSPAGNDLAIERSVLAGIQVEMVGWSDQASLVASVRDADGVMCMHARFDETVIHSLRQCKVIARFGTGTDNIDEKAAKEAGIPVVAIPDYCIHEVATHTMALILAWNRKILEYHEFVQQKRWNERKQTTGNWGCGPVSRLATHTLGLLGLGRIGRAVAQRALSFGMTVIAHDPFISSDVGSERAIALVARDELLAESDYISLHLPLTEGTCQIINTETINLMKPSAVLVNVARGGLVDERALAQALGAGRLAGALLDVYEHAPLPVNHPFRALKNVIFTPHIAFYSEEALVELRRRAAEAVLRHLQER